MGERVVSGAEKIGEHGERLAALEANAATSKLERHEILETTKEVREIAQESRFVLAQVMERLQTGHQRFEGLETVVTGQSRQIQDLEITQKLITGTNGKPGAMDRIQALETQQTKWNAIIGFLAMIGASIIAAGAWVMNNLQFKH